jgi:hypothetical protein
MPDRNVARKRRPVDVLFGDRSATYTDYVIEAPQPVTTVSPPPPDLVVNAEPEPLPPIAAAPVQAAPVDQALALTPQPKPIDDKPTDSKPSSTPEPMPEPKVAAAQDHITQMYDRVRSQLRDTPKVAKECMELLLEARIASSEGDLATAEFYTETVDARLAQSALSQQSGRRPIVWIIGLWNIVTLVVAGAVLVGSYLLTPSLFGVAVAPEIVLLLRTVSCGVIGAVLGVILNLVRSLSHREYDPANELGYFAKAVLGAEFGGVLSITFQIVAVLATGVVNLVQSIHIFTYLLALMVGFGQDTITEFFSGFRSK